MKDMFAQGGSGSAGIKTNKQAIARKYGVKPSEVVYFSVGQPLTGYKIIYDKESQRAFPLPFLAPGVQAVSLTNGVLVHSTGTIDLGQIAVYREDFHFLQTGVVEGVTLSVRNDAIVTPTGNYIWAGDLPKEVPPGSTIEGTGGEASNAWIRIQTSSLKYPGGDKLIGSSYGGTVFDDYLYKKEGMPATVIDPSMSNAAIQAKLAQGGTFYFSAGTYTVSSTLSVYPNTEIFWSPGAVAVPASNNMTVMACDPALSGGNGVRNVKLHNVRIDISAKTGCKGFSGVRFRNHGHLDMMWVNMGTAQNNTGIEIGTLCYGLKVDGCEVIGGGAGSVRLLCRNGANAIVVTGFDGYSGSPEVDMPNYGIIVRHGINGETSWDYINNFPTEAVVFVGGFSQNTIQYGLLDQAQATKVYGMYFENNYVADVRASTGAVGGTYAHCTHSSPTAGVPASAYSTSGALGILIDEPIYGSRAGGFFNCGGGSNATATSIVININRWNITQGVTLADLGDVSAAKVKRNGVLQLTADTLNVNQGFDLYRRNVTSGTNIAFTGTPYDGQLIKLLVRGSNIASLSVAGVPVNVTGANTAQIKMTIIELYYSSAVSAWVMNTGEWNATA